MLQALHVKPILLEVSLLGAGELRSILSNATSRLSAAESMLEASVRPVSSVVPSGSVMQAAGSFSPADGTPSRVALKSNRLGHLRGFLAVAILPSDLSRNAYARSPSKPRS